MTAKNDLKLHEEFYFANWSCTKKNPLRAV